MSSQQLAISAATEFLTTYILTNRELNGQFKTVLNKREANDLDEDAQSVGSAKKNSGTNEISSTFWKEVRWSLSQATIESFVKFFKSQEGNEDTAREALKSVSAIAFDLSNTSSLSDYIASTPSFEEYKQKSLVFTKKQLVEVEKKYNEYKGSGRAVNTTDQKNHDLLVGRLKEIIERGGQPVFTPPEFIKCYTAMLDDVIARATDVMQWSSTHTVKDKPIRRKKGVINGT